MPHEFQTKVVQIMHLLDEMQKAPIALTKQSFTDFNASKQAYNSNRYKKVIEELKQYSAKLRGDDEHIISLIKDTTMSIPEDVHDIAKIKGLLMKVADLLAKVELEEQQPNFGDFGVYKVSSPKTNVSNSTEGTSRKTISSAGNVKTASPNTSQRPQETKPFSISMLPQEIRGAVNADIDEINACLNAGCYRSVVILCGRVMEVALHRVYFDATGVDLLEKAPGTGLGNLIAKLNERNVKLDPGLPNQIHLINNIRIFSVHAKQDSFAPSQAQAQAIYLYTMDTLSKLFVRK